MNTASSKSGKSETKPEAESLAADLAALRAQVEALVEKLGAAASEETRKARDQIAEGLVEDWQEIDRKVAEATRRAPWRALALAALFGLALGAILRR